MLARGAASRGLGVRASLERARARYDARHAGQGFDQRPVALAVAGRSRLPEAAPSSLVEGLVSFAGGASAAAGAVEASGPPRRCLRQASHRMWWWLVVALLLAIGLGTPPTSPPPPPTLVAVLLYSGQKCGTVRSPALTDNQTFNDQHECLTS